MTKLYIKENDKFTEHEDTPELRQAVHINKQLKESKGIKYEIFTPEQLSDEDALELGVRTQKEIGEREKQKRISEIKSELQNIDMKSIRPARAGETARLAELEAEAEILRAELAGIK